MDKKRPYQLKGESLEEWLRGPKYDSDEYDTDLEEDFQKEQDPTVDASGSYYYEERCDKRGG